MLTHIQYKTMPLLWSINTCLKVTYRHKKPMSCCYTSIVYFIELQAIDSHYSFFLLSVNQLYIFLNYCWFRYLRMAENTSTYNCEPYNIGQCVHFCSRAWRIIRVIERRYVNISGRAWWDQWWNTPCYYHKSDITIMNLLYCQQHSSLCIIAMHVDNTTSLTGPEEKDKLEDDKHNKDKALNEAIS